ncbi:MAG TPA: phosphotransferase family protein [Frankiaceae bacterium]|nr:phosphotransferase family protein [Frankiaceae bacterium]
MTADAADAATPIDQPRDVRADDAIDAEKVGAWLAERVPGLAGTPDVKQYSGGASNLTYLLRYPDRDLILRRPPAGTKAKSAHDMRREYRIQSLLKPTFPYVPEMVAFCDDPDVLGDPADLDDPDGPDAAGGADFYVMERLSGIILRGRLPQGMVLPPEQARALCDAVVNRLVELHAVDVTATGLDEFGRGSGYVGRQVAGWSQRYRAAKTWNVPSFEKVMGWLEANQPEDVGTCLIHNDWRLDNLVLDADDPGQILGVLDWEMATVGDPLMDLGSAMAYWVQADDDRLMGLLRRQPTHLPGMRTRDEMVRAYCERSGRPVDDWTFYEVFGLFRLAVIVQQIYFRYAHKQTRNPAFRHFWIAVNYLDRRCRRLIPQVC